MRERMSHGHDWIVQPPGWWEQRGTGGASEQGFAELDVDVGDTRCFEYVKTSSHPTVSIRVLQENTRDSNLSNRH